jgi:hypothetical protein
VDETAAHLVDRVFPQLPVRQWVLSLSKCLRYFLHHDAGLVKTVQGIFLTEVEAALNAHLHFHCCVIAGVFSAV